MKKNLRMIKIGHGAYSGDNALKFVVGKAAAVRELRNRGYTRNAARAAVNVACSKPNGYTCVVESHTQTEIHAMNTDAAWEGYPQ